MMSIALFSLFQTGTSWIDPSYRCYSCNWDVEAKKISLNSTDLECDHPIEVLCAPGEVCGNMPHEKDGKSVVIKYCIWEGSCPAGEEYGFIDKAERDRLVKCCNENFCNGSENVFFSKVLFFTFSLISVSKLFF